MADVEPTDTSPVKTSPTETSSVEPQEPADQSSWPSWFPKPSVKVVIFFVIMLAFAVTFIALYILEGPAFEFQEDQQKIFTAYQYYGKNLTAGSNNQISCPSGTSPPQIISAYWNVYDPYLECLEDPRPGASTNLTCGPSWLGGDGPDPGERVAPYVMGGEQYGGQAQCSPQDVTAYVAELCSQARDNQCSIGTLTTQFPYPCNNAIPGQELYNSLPESLPTNDPIGSGGDGVNQGYRLSVQYSCPPLLN